MFCIATTLVGTKVFNTEWLGFSYIQYILLFIFINSFVFFLFMIINFIDRRSFAKEYCNKHKCTMSEFYEMMTVKER